jgi:hypothetical protein
MADRGTQHPQQYPEKEAGGRYIRDQHRSRGKFRTQSAPVVRNKVVASVRTLWTPERVGFNKLYFKYFSDGSKVG